MNEDIVWLTIFLWLVIEFVRAVRAVIAFWRQE